MLTKEILPEPVRAPRAVYLHPAIRHARRLILIELAWRIAATPWFALCVFSLYVAAVVASS